jgi:hypothetical protein
MNRTIAATTVAAACALTTPALAQGVTMYGHGSWKGGCGEWARITATNSIDEFSYTSWLLGYLSAVNELVPGIDDVTGGRANVSVLDWMKLWCRNHPLDQTANAANALIKELASRQGGTAPTPQPAPRVSKIPRSSDQLLPPR